jgi:hypothetical protein
VGAHRLPRQAKLARDAPIPQSGGKPAALPRVLQRLRERGPPPDDGGLSLALPASNAEALR